MQQQTTAVHDGLRILSNAVMQARAADNSQDDGAVDALGYRCIPDAEQTGQGTWRAVVRAEGRGETFTVVGPAFETADAAIAHAATASLVDLYNGNAAA